MNDDVNKNDAQTTEAVTETTEQVETSVAENSQETNMTAEPENSTEETKEISEVQIEETPAVEEQKTEETETASPSEDATTPQEPEKTDDQATDEAASEQPAGEPASQTDGEDTTPAPTNENPNARWYVVHTYSGHENKVATTLKQKIETERLEDKILDVLVPVQDKIEIKGGKKATVKEKIFPGYILVKMVLDDISWLAVRTTQGVTSFVGIGNKPTPISEQEVQTIVKFTQTQTPVYKQVFNPDDTVKIVEGPFAEFIGKIDSVDEEKGKVRVLVSIFGRETPVELDFLQVQKI